MLILDWMKLDVIFVTPETTLLKCSKLFKEHNITTMPVLTDAHEVVGVVTRTDVQGLMPRAELSRDIVDALESMERTKVKSFMSKPVMVDYRGTVPQAARLMVDKHVRFLPVVGEGNKRVGILTEWDVFQALSAISAGGMTAGVELVCDIENKQGALREIIGHIRDCGPRIATVQSVLSEDASTREVLICFWADDPALESKALDSLRDHPGLRFWNHRGVIFIRDQVEARKTGA